MNDGIRRSGPHLESAERPRGRGGGIMGSDCTKFLKSSE